MKKISVIIPAYNQGKYLRECLDSVIKQSLDDLEILIINDGSTDDTEFICKEYAKKDGRIKYFYKQNGGLGSARNTGIEMADSEYVFFLDSDDKIEINTLENLYIFASDCNSDITYFDILVTNENLDKLYLKPTFTKMQTNIKKKDALYECFQPSHVWARLYKTSLIKNEKFLNIWYEDMEWFPRVLAKANTIGYFKLPLYYYRQQAEGITHQEKAPRNLEVIDAWKQVLNIKNLHADEFYSLRESMIRSVCEFIYFRKNFISYFIDFYNANFCKEAAEESNIDIEIMCCKLPIWEQAKFYKNDYIISLLESLQNVIDHGGTITFKEELAVAKQEKQGEGQNIIIIDGNANLIMVKSIEKNLAMVNWYKFWSKQNLISLKGEMKKIQSERELLVQCLLNGYRIILR